MTILPFTPSCAPVGSPSTRRCFECTEYDTEVSGDFREPTAEEWAFICDNVCPWDGTE